MRASLGLGVLLAGLLCGCVESVFYYPDRNVYDHPERAGLAYEAVEFASADGTRLSGWFIPAADVSDPRAAKGTVIHFHGNAQNMTAHWRFAEWLPRHGYNLFVFDYRGYGASAGAPGIRGVFEDANAAIDYVRARSDVNPRSLFLFAQSLGGANAIAALGAGNRKGVRAIAVECTFYSYSSIANDKVAGGGLLVSDTYSPEGYVDKIAPIPFLLLHGTADRVIPFAHAERLIARAHAPKQLVRIEGGDHLQAFSPASGTIYREQLLRFFESAPPALQ